MTDIGLYSKSAACYLRVRLCGFSAKGLPKVTELLSISQIGAGPEVLHSQV